ncbi:MAG: isochorismate synthase [Rhodothermales bacterium]
MARPHPSCPVATPLRTDAVRRLAAGVRRRLERGPASGTWRVECIEVEAEVCEPLTWLAAQTSPAKLYWHGRGEEEVLAGTGVADLIAGTGAAALDQVQGRLDRLTSSRVRYVGGLRFESLQPANPEWEAFGAARFVLPRVELRRAGGRARLAANLVLPRDAREVERVVAEIEGIRWPDATRSAALPLPVARTDAPGPEGWRQSIKAALHAFESTDLQKVVLARRARYEFDEPLDPFALTRRLEAATPACFHFLVQPVPGVAFVGASPERLFRRDGTALRSEAVAGTRPRGQSDAADAQLRDELRMSDKDQREHGFVREQIRNVLTPFSETLDVESEASDMVLARGRHLYSGITATLKSDVRSLDLLRALHPTPAVGGTPTDAARAMIRTAEPFDRGWYAGPVGWVGKDAAEFAVGIRSGLVQEGATPSLALYSGAGIVRGSEAGAEWAEIEHKISDFARVLGLDA